MIGQSQAQQPARGGGGGQGRGWLVLTGGIVAGVLVLLYVMTRSLGTIPLDAVRTFAQLATNFLAIPRRLMKRSIDLASDAGLKLYEVSQSPQKLFSQIERWIVDPQSFAQWRQAYESTRQSFFSFRNSLEIAVNQGLIDENLARYWSNQSESIAGSIGAVLNDVDDLILNFGDEVISVLQADAYHLASSALSRKTQDLVLDTSRLNNVWLNASELINDPFGWFLP